MRQLRQDLTQLTKLLNLSGIATPPPSRYLACMALKFGFNSLPALPRINEGSGNLDKKELRDKMSKCSLLAGLCISQTRTALCHSISNPITLHFGVPHGLACAFSMPDVLKLNLTDDDGRLQNLQKFLGFSDIHAEFKKLNKLLQVNERIKKYVPNLKNLLKLSKEMYTSERANNNLVEVNIGTIERILKTSWDESI